MASAVALAPGTECMSRRLALGLSRAQLSRLALVDQSSIWRLETGKQVGDLTRARVERALAEAEAEEEAA